MITAKLPKAYQMAAERVFTDIATRICGELTSWDWSLCKEQITLLRTFLHANLSAIGDRTFALELSQDNDADGQPLTANAIATANQAEPTLIRVGPNLRILTYTTVAAPNPDEEQEFYSRLSRKGAVVYYEQRSQVFIYANGFTCGRIDPRFAGARVGRSSPFVRRPEQYRQAILDHYRMEVLNWNKTDHWANPAKRLLRAKLGRAKRTEDIFLNALLNWLELSLGASAHIRGKVGQISTDETDIEINALNQVYLIEIKWMGQNENKTRYGLTRLEQGLRQVKDYLQKQGHTKEATLLAYDGRAIQDFETLPSVCEEPEYGCKMLTRCNNQPVPPYGYCMVLFLESRTASQK